MAGHAAALAAETLVDINRLEYAESRRKENTLWRLWFLERQRSLSDKEIAEPVCPHCAQSFGMGRVCTCRTHAMLLNIEIHSRKTSNHASPDCLSDWPKCHTPPPCREEYDSVTPLSTPWRRLLRGLPPTADLWGPPSSGSEAIRRRHENAAWRHWWATHHADSCALWTASPVNIFPPTPTSTFPGTPTTTLPGSPRGHNHSDHTQMMDSSRQGPYPSEVVYLPVPLSILPQMIEHMDHLLKNSAR